jgi:2,3-bisphosphoglycerate-independent phosphoglycerate mutase
MVPLMSEQHRPKPLVLAILDGFGEREAKDANAIKLAKTPHLDELATFPKTTIGTSGPDVGLPPGQMGNSEVGHLNFGAGRIAQMDITRIDAAVAVHALGANQVIADAIFRAKMQKCRLHLLGLVSNGGVHSSIDHLHALIEAAKLEEVPVVVHAFLDGRDTPPKSAAEFIEKLEYWLTDAGVIGTISGRYWAMDRDKRWDRVHKAFQAIVRGRCEQVDSAFEALALSYANGKSDEFVEPVRIGEYEGIAGDFMSDFSSADKRWDWYGEEVGLAFNFRPDRMRELVGMLTRRSIPDEAMKLLVERDKKIHAFQDLHFACMTEYDPALELPVAFPKDAIRDSFGEIVSRAGLAQFRCAETEKYAHVTYFFNGGREAPFAGEERKLVPSPRDVPTYDKKPEMSAAEVARSVVEAVSSDKYDFVLVNFANPDMVGHTGDLGAAVRAIEAVDTALGAVMAAVKDKHGALLVTSDHGNCEQMKDDKGRPHTAHTTNRVPLYYFNEAERAARLRDGGRICDVAPTMLAILGLEQPAEMTGASLLDSGSSEPRPAS